jgi:hypothetical protein
MARGYSCFRYGAKRAVHNTLLTLLEFCQRKEGSVIVCELMTVRARGFVHMKKGYGLMFQVQREYEGNSAFAAINTLFCYC